MQEASPSDRSPQPGTLVVEWLWVQSAALGLALAAFATACLPAPAPWPLRLLAVAASSLLPGLPFVLAAPGDRYPRRLEETLALAAVVSGLFQPLIYWGFRWTGLPVSPIAYAFLLVAGCVAAPAVHPLRFRAREAAGARSPLRFAPRTALLGFLVVAVAMAAAGRSVLTDLDRMLCLPDWPHQTADPHPRVTGPCPVSWRPATSADSPRFAGRRQGTLSVGCLRLDNQTGNLLQARVLLEVRAPEGCELELLAGGRVAARLDLHRGVMPDGRRWTDVRAPCSLGHGFLTTRVALAPGPHELGVQVSGPPIRDAPSDLAVRRQVRVRDFTATNPAAQRARLLEEFVAVAHIGQFLNAHEAYGRAEGASQDRWFTLSQPPRGYYSMAAALLCGGPRLSSIHLMTLVQLALLAVVSVRVLAATGKEAAGEPSLSAHLAILLAALANGLIVFHGPAAYLQDTTYALDLCLAALYAAQRADGPFVAAGLLAGLGRQPGPYAVALLPLGAIAAGRTAREALRVLGAYALAMGAAYGAMAFWCWQNAQLGEWLGLLYYEAVTEHTLVAGHQPTVPGALAWLGTFVIASWGLVLAGPWATARPRALLGTQLMGYAALLCWCPLRGHYFVPLVAFSGILAASAADRAAPGRWAWVRTFFLVGAAVAAYRSFVWLDRLHFMFDGRLTGPP